MIDRALDYLVLGGSKSASNGKTTSRPLVTSRDIRELTEPVEQCIIKHPAAALATAFLVGVVVAWWIKRK